MTRGAARCVVARAILAVLAVLALTLICPMAGAAPIELTAGEPHVSLEGRLEHFADDSGVLSFEAVQTHEFVRLPFFRSQGHDKAAHWYRFEIGRAADAPTSWILSVGIPRLDEVDVWVERPEGGFRTYALGAHRPFVQRPLQTRLFAVPVEVFERTHVYVRVRTDTSIRVTAELWQPQAMMADEIHTHFYQWLYFGILLLATVLYAVLGAWSRDAILGTYAGYVASLIPLHMGYNGYLPMLLDSNWLNDAVWRASFLSGTVFIVLMWNRLMEMRRNFPRLHRLYQGIALFNAALIPIVNTPLYVALGPLLNPVVMLVAILTPTLMGILWWRNRRIELLLYFVAFLIPAIGAVLQALVAMGSVPNSEFTAHAYQLASLIHVGVMSCGLALRLRKMHRDKAAAEQEVVVTTRRADEQRRFVAMLSHEFRNPLAAIDRAAQMLRIKIPEMQPPEAKRIELIRSNAATLSGFVDNFLMTEALDHGAMALSRQHCVLRPLLEAAVAMQGEGAAERVQLSVTPPDAAFDVDPTLIGVAVGNLLGNALRYSPAGSPVEVTAALDDGALRIRVADHGPGMSADELAKLGMPYYRARSSLGKKGSGLGYHFTRRIVEAHCGELTARSREGKGLEVELVLGAEAA